MSDYITIDGGTTNTRITLYRYYKPLDSVKLNIGARASIGDNSALKQGIKSGIEQILAQNNLKQDNIVRVLASGMLTSESGILELEHIKAPAGIPELHDSMFETFIPEICGIKFCFIRGVKTQTPEFEDFDVMRGEETELFGNKVENSATYIFPGSHSKIIKTDGAGRIASSMTMLTGEMISALSENTILKSSVNLKGSEIDEDFLVRGFLFCRENGINEALFKVRILKNFFCRSDSQTYSFFMGAVLCGEVLCILKTHSKKIIVGGQKAIKNAILLLLGRFSETEIIMLPDEDAESATSHGMIKIYEYHNQPT